MPDVPPAIEARKLTKQFGGLRALEELDLEIGAGDTVALFGPNGAGKTTLIRLLTLGLRPTSGTIRLNGLDPRNSDLEIKSETGVISHRRFLYDELTARENLEFFARLYGVSEPASRSAELLEEVGLTGRADDLFKTFSRGMQQRLSLARCLAHDPKTVFLDEPFTGLDPHAAQMLRRTLERLREGGRTVVLATHNHAEGLELCGRWILLHRGRLIDQGVSSTTDRHEFERTYHTRLRGPGFRAGVAS